jgi:hypothetical protein
MEFNPVQERYYSYSEGQTFNRRACVQVYHETRTQTVWQLVIALTARTRCLFVKSPDTNQPQLDPEFLSWLKRVVPRAETRTVFGLYADGRGEHAPPPCKACIFLPRKSDAERVIRMVSKRLSISNGSKVLDEFEPVDIN